MSATPFVSIGTRLEALLENTTNLPSALIEGSRLLKPFCVCSLVALVLILEIDPVARLRIKISHALLVSLGQFAQLG